MNRILPVAVIALAAPGCALPTPDEFQEEQARFNREFAKNLRASLKTLRGPPPRPIEEMRADATAQFDESERLREEALQRFGQLADHPNARPDQRRYAQNAAAHLRMDQRHFLPDYRRALASDNWRAIQDTYELLTNDIHDLQRQLAEVRRRLRRLDGADATASPLGEVSPAEQRLSDEVEELRAQGTAALADIETMYDELIRVLEAVAAAHTDSLDQKAAQDRVAIARLAKRHDLGRWQDDIDADHVMRVRAGRDAAERSKTSLAAQIADAQSALQRLRP
ncbi:MAG: hypothetical protein OYL41_05390 [Acidobacteriota bacterium]|nr:hypothetical protein [Acidobacteriota bacterium]